MGDISGTRCIRILTQGVLGRETEECLLNRRYSFYRVTSRGGRVPCWPSLVLHVVDFL